MTHDELLEKISLGLSGDLSKHTDILPDVRKALRAVVELHKPDPQDTRYCEAENEWVSWNEYPCETIQAIEKELK